jgi:hypothetical protein
MLVSEVWSAAKSSRGYGSCSNDKLYDAITEAVTILSDKGDWDWMVGHMTLCAFDGYIVLPREVEKIMGANVNGYPTWARDKWYVHHINGIGEYSRIDAFMNFHDECGEVSTFRAVPEPSFLLGVPEDESDNGQEMIVQGYDWTDRELHHIDPTSGKQVKGIRVPISTAAVPGHKDDIVVKTVTRVIKPQTAGMVALWAVPQCWTDGTSEATMIGNYYPDEVAPRYRKYRFPKESCLNIHYRRKNLRFQSQNDFIPFDNVTALLLMLKAVRHYHEANIGNGQPLEDKAVDLLRSAEAAKKARDDIGPQIMDFSSDNSERLRSGSGGRSSTGSCCC